MQPFIFPDSGSTQKYEPKDPYFIILECNKIFQQFISIACYNCCL